MALDAGQSAAPQQPAQPQSLSASMAADAGATLSSQMARDATAANDEAAKPAGWTMGKPGLGLGTGLGEGALALGTGTAGALTAGAMGIPKLLGFDEDESWEDLQKRQQALQSRVQYQPQTTVGKGIAAIGGWAGGKIDELGAWAAEHAGNLAEAAGADPTTVAAIKTGTHAATMALAPPIAGKVAGAGVSALKSIGGATADVAGGLVRGESTAPAPLYEPEATSAARAGGVVGAAAATAAGRMSTATPEMADSVAAQIADAQARFGPSWKDHFDADALDRHLNADSLGAATGAAPGRLSVGQAAHDPVIVSEEMNNRG